MKIPFRPSTLLIQAIALLAAAASCLRAQSPIGAGPYYQFDVAGKIGTALDTGEVISNNYYPSDTTLEAIPDHFAMNDAGDILAPHKVAKQSDAVLRTAVALYHQTVPIVITREGYGLGGISDNGTVFLGNEIFYRDAYKTDATGYISQVILNPDGSFKDSPPPIYASRTLISRNGSMFFKGFDRRLFVDPTEGYAYYRVSGAGAPPQHQPD